MSYNAIINTNSTFYAVILFLIQHCLALEREIYILCRFSMVLLAWTRTLRHPNSNSTQPMPASISVNPSLSHYPFLSNATFTSELSSSLKHFTRTCLSALTPFVAQQHPSFCGAGICQDTLWTDKNVRVSSSGFTYHSWATSEHCLSVHVSLLLISSDWTLVFFLALGVPQNCCPVPTKTSKPALR